MSDKNTGGPAFPGVEYKAPTGGGNHIMTIVGGMTLRDYFAAKALQAQISIPEVFTAMSQRQLSASDVAGSCYEWADAMLKERIG